MRTECKYWTFLELNRSFRSIYTSDLGLNSFEPCFCPKNKGSTTTLESTTFMYLLLRPCILSFFQILYNQWRLDYWNWKLCLVFASLSKSLTAWPQLINTECYSGKHQWTWADLQTCCIQYRFTKIRIFLQQWFQPIVIWIVSVPWNMDKTMAWSMSLMQKPWCLFLVFAAS